MRRISKYGAVASRDGGWYDGWFLFWFLTLCRDGAPEDNPPFSLGNVA